MRKLLAALLAMVMGCASMGVFAEGEETELAPLPENVLLQYGFEDDDDLRLGGAMFTGMQNDYGTRTILDSTVDTTETVKPVSGTKYLKLENSTTGRGYISSFKARMPVLEAKTQYKFSFYWHSDGTLKYPALYLTGPVNMQSHTRTNYIFPNTVTDNWVKFEVYFVTSDTVAEDHVLTARLYTVSGTEYYDDFKLEKVNGASLRFVSGTATVTQDATLTGTVLANKDRYKYYSPKNTYTIDGSNPYIWGVMSSGKEATSCTGDINIVSHYLPKTIGEQTTLFAAIYKDEGGKPVLQKILTDNYTYGTTEIAETKAMAAHTRMSLGLNILPVAASELEAGSYIKAFMWSSTQGMIPLGDDAVLGK